MDNYNNNKKHFLVLIKNLKKNDIMTYLFYCVKYSQELTVQKLKDFGLTDEDLDNLESKHIITLLLSDTEKKIRVKENKPKRLYYDRYFFSKKTFDKMNENFDEHKALKETHLKKYSSSRAEKLF